MAEVERGSGGGLRLPASHADRDAIANWSKVIGHKY
jgi:hypothetical protein